MGEIDPKKWLSQGYFLDKRIEVLRWELSMLESQLDIGSPKLDPVGGSPGNNWTGTTAQIRTADRIVDLEREIKDEIDKLADIKFKIHQVISQVADPRQQLILRLRYVFNKSFSEITEDLDLTPKKTRILFQNGLKNVEEILKKGLNFPNS